MVEIGGFLTEFNMYMTNWTKLLLNHFDSESYGDMIRLHITGRRFDKTRCCVTGGNVAIVLLKIRNS